MDPEERRVLLNPLSQDAALLRIHPLEGVLAAVSVNVRRQQPDVAVFEIGKTYEPDKGETGAREPRWVTLALTGARAELAWHTADARADVYDAKGLAEHVLDALGVGGLRPGGAGRLAGFEPDCHGTLATARGAVPAGFGELSARGREALGIDATVVAAPGSLAVS